MTRARRRSITLVLTVLLGSAAILSFGGGAKALGPVFVDSFETGNLSKWTASSGVVVQQQQVFSGSWAARATSTGTAAYAYKSLSSPLLELYYDARFKVLSQDTTNVSLVRLRTAANVPLVSMFRLGTTGKLSYLNGFTNISTSGPVVSTGSWHELEVHVVINGSSSLIETWLDGVQISALTKTDSLGTAAVGRVYIGDLTTGHTFDMAFDSELVSTASDVSAPTTPTGLTATAVGSNHVDLSWSPSADNVGVAGYTVYRGGVAIATVQSGTSYSDTSVSPGSTYSYTVEAFDGVGNASLPSEPAVVDASSDTQPPTQPTGLTASVISPTRVDLVWTAATDNVGVTGYTVYRNGTQFATVGAAPLTYSDGTVTPGTTYTYTVDAFDAAANHSLQSAPASATPGTPPANTALPTISGSAVEGQTLTADPGSWSGTQPITYAYQWRRCDSGGGNCSDIGSATTQSYVLMAADVGSTIRVRVTGTNSAGSSSANSAQTTVVTGTVTAPANTALPTISGSAVEGQTLTADPGSWSGTQPITYAYQWRRCDSGGGNCSDIGSATTQSYVLMAADVGSTIRVRVTGTNSAGSSSANSAQTTVVTGTVTAPANTALPTISGSAVEGQTLTADPGSWSGTQPITYAYQWRRCDSGGGNCSDIGSATTQSYVLMAADVGSTIRVRVTGTNSAGSSSANSAQTTVVTGTVTAPANTALPTISGSAVEGQTLTADPGSWSGTQPITYAYQWRRCDSGGGNCSDIGSATTQSYVLMAADVGSTIRVRVTGTNSAGSSSANSAQTTVVTGTVTAPANTALPTISGSAVEGQTLTAGPGSWSGTQPITYAYQWRRCDSGGGACVDIIPVSGPTYTLTGADVGSTIRVHVTATNSGGSSNAQSAATAVVQDQTPPTAPTGLSGAPVSPTRIDLSWTASTDNVGVTGYAIYRDGDEPIAIVGAVTTYSDTTVVGTTTYRYRVAALDAAGNASDLSEPLPVTTPQPADNTPPTRPLGLSATVAGPSQVDLSWSAASDNVGVTGYTIYRNGVVLANVGVGVTTFADTTTDNGATYTYEVDAFDAAANHSPQSASATVTTHGVIFSDSFETGNMSNWTSSTAGVTVQQQHVFSGSWAARATTTGPAAYAYKALAQPLLELYYDGRFKVISQGNDNVSLIRLRTINGGSILSMLRRGNNGKLSYFNEVTGVSTTGPSVSAGSWHELQVHVRINGTTSLIETWLDGAKISAFSKTDSLGTTPVGRIYFGDPGAGRTFDIAFDSQVISTASDVSPPSTPTGLTATAIGSNRVNLTWSPSSDNLGVDGYTIYRGGTTVARVGGWTTGYADAGVSPSTSYTYTVDAIDVAGNHSAQASPASVTTPAPSGGDPVVGIAGDIACDPTAAAYNNGNGTATECRQKAVSNILFNSNLAAVLPLGDIQYENGALWKFQQSFEPSWGRLGALLRPIPGNHEYLTAGASGYFSFFGATAGDPTKGYYSYDIGTWHFIALNSQCAEIGGCGDGSPQEVWLEADLAAHSNACTVAYWHHPRYSSGFHGDDSAYATFWWDLASAGADIVLTGHDHHYERFAPLDASGQFDPNGMRSFVVGTGGKEHQPVNAPRPNSQIINNNTFGILKLTLHPTSYDWQFVPEAGATFTDSGSGTCH